MRKKKGKAASLVFLFSCCLCPVLGPGRVQRNREKRMPVWHGQAEDCGSWGQDPQGDRRDGRKVKDWGKQMCIRVYILFDIP